MSNNTNLTKDQEDANNAFLDFLVSDDNFFVIQGAAGTGKSFLIKYLLETFYAKYKSYCLLLQKDVQQFDIKITATTNKAVNVIEGFLEPLLQKKKDLSVSTIFSLLGLKVTNDYKTGKTTLTFNNRHVHHIVSQDGVTPLVFIDEASFIGEDLHHIIESNLYANLNAKIVYIGDKYQLAPVGQSFSAMDQLNCKKVELKEVIRNQGAILDVGTQFRDTVETGRFNPIKYNLSDVIHVKGSQFKDLIESSFADSDWTPNKSKVLAWTNDQVQAYNMHIRTFLGMPEKFQENEIVITNEFIKGKNFTRSVDSEVRITRIGYELVENYGVKGYMIELDYSHVGFMPENYKDAKKLLKGLAKDKEWKKYFEVKETWLDLRPIYASSIHKSQGSTYETVFLDLSDISKNWNKTDVARLLYVGITRASKQVICYGYLSDRYC